MKLTRNRLKKLILEVMHGESMILTEAEEESGVYEDLIRKLEGHDGSVNTIGIMSGQNPMAKDDISPEEQEQRAQSLLSDLQAMGMDHLAIDGNYGNLPEKSVVIFNPSMEEMENINRKYEQEAFVYGKKAQGIDEQIVIYEMRNINYQGSGSSMAPGSKRATRVMKHEELAAASTNYSEIDGKRFGFELY